MVRPPNNYRAAFVGRFDNYVIAFTTIFKRRPLHSLFSIS